MELGQAKAFGPFNHHHSRIGDVDPDLNDGRGDQEAHARRPAKGLHDGVFILSLHLTMDEADFFAENILELGIAVFGGGKVAFFALFDQGTDPIDLRARVQGSPHGL